jgi:hypothetical protein
MCFTSRIMYSYYNNTTFPSSGLDSGYNPLSKARSKNMVPISYEISNDIDVVRLIT